MKQIENTVFISYRRKDVSWALNVYQDLMHKRYDVFFDYTSIPSGDFEQIIIGNIKARAHFVLILTPTTFDRCGEPGDWLRREIETAIDEKRNIIPLFFEGFNFGSASVSEKLTGKLWNVSRYNGFNVYYDYFQAAMQRLCTQFLNVPLDAVLHPVSPEVRKVVEVEQLAVNKALLQSSTEKPASGRVIPTDFSDWLQGVEEESAKVAEVETGKDDTPPWLLREEWETEELILPNPTSPSDKHSVESEEARSVSKPEPAKKKPGLRVRQPQSESQDVATVLSQAKSELDRGDIPVALDHYGKLIKKGKHLEETIRDLNESLYRYPVEVGIWQTLGDAYMRANRKKEALEAYNKAEELIR